MPTLHDVAKVAGVSASTVSRVFNKPEIISQKTRDHVLQIAEQMGFRPNYFASALNTQQTLLVGVVCPDITNPYAAMLAKGVQDVLAGRDYLTVICSTDGDTEKELAMLREMHYRGVDGFIVTPSQLGSSDEVDDYLFSLLRAGIPIIFIGNRLERADVDSVTSRAQNGAVSAVNHLIELGHRRIGFIGGYYTRGVAVGRWLGYQEALVSNGLIPDQHYMIEADLSQSGGGDAMHRLLRLDEPPTAVFAVNDVMALGALGVCKDEGIDVPKGMSIIGFDDIPVAAQVQPALTTVAQPTYALGRKAAELFLFRLENANAPPEQVVLQCQLIERASTAAFAQPKSE